MPAANADRFEALTWLMDRGRYRVAGQLWTAWDSAIDEIAEMFRRFPSVEDAPRGKEVRECYIPRFGYRIVFQVLPNEIRIVSFGRARRHVSHWLDRLDETSGA